jgi:hypothetical protein
VSIVVAGLMSWPLPLHLDSHVAKDLSDPSLQAWQLSWGGHALRSQPLDYFQSNTFYPLHDTLAFSDALVGYAPAGLLGNGFRAALVRYNLLFIFSSAFAAVGAFLLARELELTRTAAAVGAVAFAFAPWRLEQTAHLHILASGGVVLTFFLLLRGYRRASASTVFAGWLVAAWQLTLGWNLGVPLAYALAAICTFSAILWLAHGRPAFDRRLLIATACGGVVFLSVAAVLAQPYLAVADDYPEARRTVDQVRLFSPPIDGFLAAPADNLLWGGATAGVRSRLPWPPEQELFPGVAILALAAVGALFGRWTRRRRTAMVACVLVFAFLSTGLTIAGGWLGYRWLFEFAPGFDALRTPSRLNLFTSLALALLAATGADRLGQWAGRGNARAAWLLGVLLAAVIAVEGLGPAPVLRVPPPPRGLSQAPEPRLQLPIPTLGAANFLYMLWSVEGFPRIVNGSSGFQPRLVTEVRQRVRGFPDRRSVEYLRRLGVRSVVFKTSDGAPRVGPAARALGLRIRTLDEVTIYELSMRPRRFQVAQRRP